MSDKWELYPENISKAEKEAFDVLLDNNSRFQSVLKQCYAELNWERKSGQSWKHAEVPQNLFDASLSAESEYFELNRTVNIEEIVKAANLVLPEYRNAVFHIIAHRLYVLPVGQGLDGGPATLWCRTRCCDVARWLLRAFEWPELRSLGIDKAALEAALQNANNAEVISFARQAIAESAIAKYAVAANVPKVVQDQNGMKEIIDSLDAGCIRDVLMADAAGKIQNIADFKNIAGTVPATVLSRARNLKEPNGKIVVAALMKLRARLSKKVN